MSKAKIKVDADFIEESLPAPDVDYNYEVEQVSPLVYKVWLKHPDKYLFKEDVRTIYCFIKGQKVYPPKNTKHMRPKSVCHISDLWKQRWQTTIEPTTTSLRWMD